MRKEVSIFFLINIICSMDLQFNGGEVLRAAGDRPKLHTNYNTTNYQYTQTRSTVRAVRGRCNCLYYSIQ